MLRLFSNFVQINQRRSFLLLQQSTSRVQYAFASTNGRNRESGKICFYKVLNVSSDAKFEEIKASYLKLAKKYHPDANPDLIQTDKFKEVSEAYNVLSNKEKRADYDASQGLKSRWQYEQDNEGAARFTNDTVYEEVMREEEKKQQAKVDEVAFDYFEKKYLKNEDAYRKNVQDDSEFELTMKLYREHKENVTEKKKDYIEFMPFTSSNYFVHKEVESHAVSKNTTQELLKDFAVPLSLLAVVMAFTGAYSAFSIKDDKSNQISQKQILTQGAGYRPSYVPVNIV